MKNYENAKAHNVPFIYYVLFAQLVSGVTIEIYKLGTKRVRLQSGDTLDVVGASTMVAERLCGD